MNKNKRCNLNVQEQTHKKSWLKTQTAFRFVVLVPIVIMDQLIRVIMPPSLESQWDQLMVLD